MFELKRFEDTEHGLRSLDLLGKSYARLIVRGLCLGFCAGVVIALFRLAHTASAAWVAELGIYCSKMPWLMLLGLPVLCFAAWCVRRLVRWEPLISGSGIPQTELALAGKLSLCWWRILLSKFVGGWLSLTAGLSIGREGPCVQMGGTVGLGFSRVWEKSLPLVENPYLMGGAVAGLSAAFGAPVAGVLFAFEEMKCRKDRALILFACVSALGAHLAVHTLFGLGRILPFERYSSLPLGQSAFFVLQLTLFGVLLGLTGGLYNRCLLWVKDAEARQTLLPDAWRLVPLFCCSGLLWLLWPALSGGGESLILSLDDPTSAWPFLLLLLVGKAMFSIGSVTGTVPGGLLMPILCLGALCGALWEQWLPEMEMVSSDASFIGWHVLWGMAGLFAATVRAPLTGVALVTEMTGSFASLGGSLWVAYVAAWTAGAVGVAPIYDSLKERVPLSGTV